MHDTIDRPRHYVGSAGFMAIDVIEAYGLGFHLGNALKYLLRAGRKTSAQIEDLRKARWYIERWRSQTDRGVHGCERPWASSRVCYLDEMPASAVVDAFDIDRESMRGSAVCHLLAAAIADDPSDAIAKAADNLLAAIELVEAQADRMSP